MTVAYATSMGFSDEHADVEWAEFNLPADARAQPAPASPLGRRVISRQSLAGARRAVAPGLSRSASWFLPRRAF